MARTYLKVPFPQKDAAKTLGAKWDPTAGAWYVPEHMDIAAFAAWHSNSLPRELVATGSPALVPTSEMIAGPKSTVTLSRLLAGVASAVAATYRAGVWTTVEVSAINSRGGHVYLELSERDAAGMLLAKATGTIWASVANRILPEFERSTGATLAPGVKLLVRAKPVYKPQFGFSVDVDAIDPSYTLGDLEARRREIRSRLQAEGIFGAQKLLPAPWDYTAVLVVAPDRAAGLGDFQAEAQRLAGFGVCQFVYLGSRFQGEGAAAEIVAALLAGLEVWLSERKALPDAVVIIRGGGPVNDLAWLNDYALAKLICDLPVPVLTGIGHERDSTVLDEVAHTKFDTPSKVIAGIEKIISQRTHEALDAYESVMGAAELALERARNSVHRLDADVHAGARRQVELAKRMSVELLGTVKDVSTKSLHDARARSTDEVRAIRRGSVEALGLARQEARAKSDFVFERAGSHTLRVRVALDAAYGLLSQSVERTIEDAKTRSQALMREIAGQGPDKTLRRGFAIVRGAEGKPVMRTGDVADGQAISVQLSDGSIEAHVDEEKP